MSASSTVGLGGSCFACTKPPLNHLIVGEMRLLRPSAGHLRKGEKHLGDGISIECPGDFLDLARHHINWKHVPDLNMCRVHETCFGCK